jgi:hypothetical protein
LGIIIPFLCLETTHTVFGTISQATLEIQGRTFRAGCWIIHLFRFNLRPFLISHIHHAPSWIPDRMANHPLASNSPKSTHLNACWLNLCWPNWAMKNASIISESTGWLMGIPSQYTSWLVGIPKKPCSLRNPPDFPTRSTGVNGILNGSTCFAVKRRSLQACSDLWNSLGFPRNGRAAWHDDTMEGIFQAWLPCGTLK